MSYLKVDGRGVRAGGKVGGKWLMLRRRIICGFCDPAAKRAGQRIAVFCGRGI